VKLNPNTKRFRKSKLPEKYTVKLLFRWNDRKFKDELFKEVGEKLAKIEVSFSRGEILKEK